MSEYDSLLYREHPTSANRPRMSRSARAAQFAPFAALEGLDAEIAERRRTTEERIELDAGEIEELNRRLSFFADHPTEEFALTYFVPDAHKVGGAYLTVRARLKRVDTVEGLLHLQDGTRIPINEIFKIETIPMTENTDKTEE